MKHPFAACLIALPLVFACSGSRTHAKDLVVQQDTATGTITVSREGESEPLVTQNAAPDHRPYLHPIMAPDGKGVLTEYSPGHHKHQTGLYWGFTRVNGRDYFHHPEGSYWKRVSADVLKKHASKFNDSVQWQTVYDLLDANGAGVLRETQVWTMQEKAGKFLLSLEWTGKALTDVTIGKYNYGGLFLRMPWQRGIQGQVFNSAREVNQRGEGRRAVWVDVGMDIEGRTDQGHIAIFDHPKNKGFPQPWRVDGQMGVGPVRARLGDWQIKKGKQEVIRHQIVVHTGELNDVALTDLWSKYTGQGLAWAQWRIAQLEGRAAEFLTPEKAVANMTVPDGFKVNSWAAEPMMTQPMAFCWDDRGRMWIAENRDYETRGSGFANSGDSRILILEDTDRDGVADKRTVFAEGIPFPAGIAVGFDGLFLGAPPNLLFVPDRNHDDKADMDDIEVRLTGWGIRDRHETLNSFHWGPDGWLYGCQGFATPSRVGKPAGKGRLYKHKDAFPQDIKFAGQPVDIDGGVWRYHPTKDRFEVVAHGFSNPWGIDFDAKGQCFITACVIPHLWHVVQGGIYHRQGGRHFNPHVYSDIRTITDHRHRSAHGGARVYLSDAFPPKYQHRLFMANIHEHAVLTDILEPSGSGFIGRHGDDFLLANNAQWIGFSMEIGPDGGVYVLDWHDADICGKDVLNKDTGRIFRVMPEQSRAKNWNGRYGDLTQQSNAQLVNLQTVPSAWHARRARVILQHRATQGKVDAAAHQALHAIFSNHANADYRLRALWALHVTGGMSVANLVTALDDQDPHVRAWAVQLLCEDLTASGEAVQKFAEMAAQEQNPVVRLYLASAIQRLGSSTAQWQVLQPLAQRDEDADDHNIPKMLWFALEPLVTKEADAALELARTTRIPLLARHVARRLTDDNQLAAVVAAVGRGGTNQLLLLQGLQDGLEGRYDVRAPDNWSNVYARLENAPADVQRSALQLSQQFGDTNATASLLKTLNDRKAPADDRRAALTGLTGRRHPELRKRIIGFLDDDVLRREAIRAMAAWDDKRIATELLRRYPSFNSDEKLEVVLTLSARSNFGWELTQAIKSGRVPREDIPAYVARLLQRVVGNGFLEVWGPLNELSADKKAMFTKFRSLLTKDKLAQADPSQGRALFKFRCGSCHKLFGEGGNIGPDITGANRTNLEYLLGNVLTPSAIIQDAYRMHVVLMDNGRVYSGIPAGENERQLRLRVANRTEPVVIAKSKIEERQIAKISMMPEGILKFISDEDVLNLFAYLQSLKQVPLPPDAE